MRQKEEEVVDRTGPWRERGSECRYPHGSAGEREGGHLAIAEGAAMGQQGESWGLVGT